MGHVHFCKCGCHWKKKQNGKQCRSWWDGSLWAISSGSTLSAKVYILVSKTEKIKWLLTLQAPESSSWIHMCPSLILPGHLSSALQSWLLSICPEVFRSISATLPPPDSIKSHTILILQVLAFHTKKNSSRLAHNKSLVIHMQISAESTKLDNAKGEFERS